MRVGGFDIDIVVQGFPGKGVCHGGLGWCSIALIRTAERTILVDTGAIAMRSMLVQRLAERGVAPEDVTDLILTHSHYDHSINWIMFSAARIYIGREEMDWAAEQIPGRSLVPELYMDALRCSPQVRFVADGEEILPGMKAFATPGHTPGHLSYLLSGSDRDVIFTGDAAKNRAELLSRDTDMTYDAAQSARSIELIWQMWEKRPGTVCVPGHDLPMVLEGGEPKYIVERKASIAAWFGRDLTPTIIELAVD